MFYSFTQHLPLILLSFQFFSCRLLYYALVILIEMPSKRKAMAGTGANQVVETSHNAKEPKASSRATAPTSKLLTEIKRVTDLPIETEEGAFKYSDANAVSSSLPYVC